MPKNPIHQKNRSGHILNKRDKYKCPVCNEGFRLLNTLEIHLQKEHNKSHNQIKERQPSYEKVEIQRN